MLMSQGKDSRLTEGVELTLALGSKHTQLCSDVELLSIMGMKQTQS